MFYCNCFEQAPPAPTLGDVNVLLVPVVKEMRLSKMGQPHFFDGKYKRFPVFNKQK